MPLLAEVAPHSTAWEELGFALLVSGVAFLYLCYWFAFKIEAKCMVVGKSTRRPCKKDGTVVLGCKPRHRLQKPIAWLRHFGAARWLDPWLYRLHIVPPSFVPMPMPMPLQTAQSPATGGVATVTRPPVAEPPATRARMSAELKVAAWSLVLGIIQTGTGVVALITGG